MSYCRFTEGDVYAYVCDGGVQFYVSDGRRELDRLCNTFNEAYQYARVLRDTHGLDVPSHAIEALKADALEEAARIYGPDSAMAELKAENAKLRELVREMMRFFKDGDYCTICEKRKECDAHEEYDDDCLMRGVFHARMRELGVEVDG